MWDVGVVACWSDEQLVTLETCCFGVLACALVRVLVRLISTSQSHLISTSDIYISIYLSMPFDIHSSMTFDIYFSMSFDIYFSMSFDISTFLYL